MIELNLKKIILNVDFSPVFMGQTESEVIKILGEPADRSDNGAGSILFAYGSYEFYFFDDELHYFQNDHLKADGTFYQNLTLSQNNYFKIDPWFIRRGKDISMREVIFLLEKEKVEFNIENQKVAGKDYRVGEVKFLELANGISMNFENSTRVFKQNSDSIESQEIIFTDEMDFVLYAIRYEHFKEMSEKSLWEEVNIILWEDWDPIGVNQDKESKTEYRGYIPSIIKLLEEGADESKITKLLHQHANVNMGLSSDLSDHVEVARKLRRIAK